MSGPEHPDTLIVRGNLARWTGEAGDAAGARDQYAALLPVRERVSGPEHPDTLTVRGNLARWTGEAGDAAGARDQYAALLPVREWVSGAEHPETLTARGNLAYWTGEAGDAAAARDQYAALLPVEERVLGAEHPHTLTTRNNLAYWTWRAGKSRKRRHILTRSGAARPVAWSGGPVRRTADQVRSRESHASYGPLAELAAHKAGGGAADRTSAKTAKAIAVVSKRCRAVLTERRR